MKKLEYSIIYGVIRPEISERLSVGLVIVSGNMYRFLLKRRHKYWFSIILTEVQDMTKLLPVPLLMIKNPCNPW